MSTPTSGSGSGTGSGSAGSGGSTGGVTIGSGYGYGDTINSLRESHFKRLKGQTYLDHGGSTLYSEVQLTQALTAHASTLYANPHSGSSVSIATRDMLDRTRDRVLSFFGTTSSQYSVIFTSGATAALKLLGEAFPWSGGSEFAYTLDNHNSVLGIREYAKAGGAVFTCVDPSNQMRCCCSDQMKLRTQSNTAALKQQTASPGNGTASLASLASGASPSASDKPFSLFAFPAESNFSGLQFDLRMTELARSGQFGHNPSPNAQWKVLVDAAKYCASHPLNLSSLGASAPDFVCVSFYKVFGYPTGLGALLVRSDAAPLLRKRYFSGGTVEAAVSNDDFVKLRASALHERFEDGTINFLSIAGLAPGFDLIERTLGMQRVMAHTNALGSYLSQRMRALRHHNGSPVVRLYGLHDTAPPAVVDLKSDGKSNGPTAPPPPPPLSVSALKHSQGPTVAFNVLKPDGSFVGYSEVDRLAVGNSIQLRVSACMFHCVMHLRLTDLIVLVPCIDADRMFLQSWSVSAVPAVIITTDSIKR